jgi:hypothetical protein
VADLSPAELEELSRRLQSLIDQARTLKEQITQRSIEQRRAERADHTGEPAATKAVKRKPRPRKPRSTN